MIATVITILIVLIAILYKWSVSTYNYWETRGVKGPKPLPFVGNFLRLLKKQVGVGLFLKTIVKEFPEEKCIGIYAFKKPALIVRDLDYLKYIIIKDFHYFPNRGVQHKAEIFNENIAVAEDDVWRILRQKLTPCFTSGKLKNMFYLVVKSGDKLQKYMDTLVDDNIECEIRALIAKYSLDVIGNCAFGIEVQTFENEDNIFTKMAHRFFEYAQMNVVLKTSNSFFPSLLEKMGYDYTRNDVKNFYTTLVKQLIAERTGKEKIRHDFMDLLIEMREQGTVKGSTKDKELYLEVTDILITAQAVVFYSAGFETAAGLMSFMIHEFALNEDIQEKARKEVDEIYSKYGEITYESMKELAYLELVMDEALRKYPVGELTLRKCKVDYKIPGTDLIIQKDTTVFIPISAIHHDPKLYPEPEKFIPERFTKENRENMHPLSYLPFGEGPRICIGLRFAKIQVLVGISKILRHFILKRSGKTEDPLTYKSTTPTMQAENGIWVDFKKRKFP